MNVLKRIFRCCNIKVGSEGGSDVDIDAVKPIEKSPDSKARDDYFADLMAQRMEKDVRMSEHDLLFGDEESITPADLKEMAQRIVQVDPMKTAKVIQEAEAEDDNDGLVVAEDGAAAGEVFKGSAPDGRYADLWMTYAQVNPRVLKHFISRAFIGYPACTILGTHELINPCCAMPGEDAIAPGYKLTCHSSEHKQDDEHIMREESWLVNLKKDADRRGLNKTLTDLSFNTRLYGIGVAIPRVQLRGNHTMEEEYDPDLIKPGSFKGFSVVDPQRFTWDLTDETLYDPISEYYMRPEFLRLFNREDTRIHRSWCVICYFREVGDDLKGTYMWGGMPLSQMLYERIYCADKLANEIVSLAMSKRVVVKSGNMEAMLADPRKTNHLIERFNHFRNNRSIAFTEPGESITQLETSLSDLQPLSAQQYQYAAAIAGIPVTKLLKNVPSGLQATGQYEQDEYEQTLKSIQEQYFHPLLTKYYELYIKSNYPDRDDLSVDISFNPIQLPKASEIQQMASQRGSMVCSLLQQSAITITEARAILKGGDSPLFSILSDKTPEALLKMEKMKDPEEQQKLQMKMQQEMGGMGGMMGGMGGAMGGGGAPGGADASGQGAEDPKFEANKSVFQDALKEVLGGESEGAGESEGERVGGGGVNEGERGESEGEKVGGGGEVETTSVQQQEGDEGETTSVQQQEGDGEGVFAQALSGLEK